MIYGTCYDYYVVIPAKEKQEIFKRQYSYLSQGSTYLKLNFPFEPEVPFIGEGTKAKESKFVNVLMMFSIRRNTEQLMNTRTQDDQINCLHGARFLSMCWIIFGHTYYYICTSFTTGSEIHFNKIQGQLEAASSQGLLVIVRPELNHRPTSESNLRIYSDLEFGIC